jgi:hypothetical protein
MPVDTLVTNALQEVNRITQKNRKRAYALEDGDGTYDGYGYTRDYEYPAGSSRIREVEDSPAKLARISETDAFHIRSNKGTAQSTLREAYNHHPSIDWHLDSPDSDDEPDRIRELIAKRYVLILVFPST